MLPAVMYMESKRERADEKDSSRLCHQMTLANLKHSGISSGTVL